MLADSGLCPLHKLFACLIISFDTRRLHQSQYIWRAGSVMIGKLCYNICSPTLGTRRNSVTRRKVWMHSLFRLPRKSLLPSSQLSSSSSRIISQQETYSLRKHGAVTDFAKTESSNRAVCFLQWYCWIFLLTAFLTETSDYCELLNQIGGLCNVEFCDFYHSPVKCASMYGCTHYANDDCLA